MTSVPIPICYSCIHLEPGEGMRCAAYPSGIPTSILESRTDHRGSHPGDHGITFEQDPAMPPADFAIFEEVEG